MHQKEHLTSQTPRDNSVPREDRELGQITSSAIGLVQAMGDGMPASNRPDRSARRVNDSDFSEWAGPELLRLRRILDAGHLNCLERVLHGTRTAHLLRYGGAKVVEEVDEIRRLLAARRPEEAAAGGTGSLVVADHSFTAVLKSLGLPLG